jgi:hypothetical protein
MRRLMLISFLLQGGKDVSIFSNEEIENAKIMYKYVNHYSGGFTCSYKYLTTLWQSAYFKIVGYNG